MVEVELERQKIDADRILKEANDKARAIELQAKNQSLEIRQTAETEVSRKRSELNKEEDRLQKRRDELDQRTDRQEKREQAINKRQSALDKRANEIEKMHEDEVEELQRISQMSVEEARGILLTEVEKDTRDDMAKIIRMIETEAREEGTGAAGRLSPLLSNAWHRITSQKSPLLLYPYRQTK